MERLGSRKGCCDFLRKSLIPWTAMADVSPGQNATIPARPGACLQISSIKELAKRSKVGPAAGFKANPGVPITVPAPGYC